MDLTSLTVGFWIGLVWVFAWRFAGEKLRERRQRLAYHEHLLHLAEMERENFGPARTVECDRCDRITESPPEGAATVEGTDITPCLLCLDCRLLALVDMRQWGECGWLRHGGSREATWDGVPAELRGDER